MKLIREILISVLVIMCFVVTFMLATLKESYKYNPPTAKERAEHPVLVRWLAGE